MIFDLQHARQLDRIEADLAAIMRSLNIVNQKETAEMATLADIKTAADASLAKARAESDALVAIAGVITDYKAKNADLQAQLAAALANNDPAAAQAVLDEMKQTNDALDANAAAEAALTGTTPADVQAA